MPLLFIEVDNCHETAEKLAAKLEKCARFFRRTSKDTDGKERPMWRTCWTVPEHPYGDAPHPPVLLVFNRIGERNPNRTVPRLQELTRHLWQGERQRGGHHLYDRKIPIIAVALPNLREHGPAGPVFLRFGRDHLQPLLEAIGNPRFEAARARAAEEARTRAAAYQEQVRRAAQARAAKQAAERETRRPVCVDCGAKFTDERWKAAQATDWGTPEDSHPHLCDSCKQAATTAVASSVRQEPEHTEADPKKLRWRTQRPVCTQCGAAFTDERWEETERIAGWGEKDPRPTLCGDCNQRHETIWDDSWPGATRQEQEPGPGQEPAVPEQKTGWLSRLRR